MYNFINPDYYVHYKHTHKHTHTLAGRACATEMQSCGI